MNSLEHLVEIIESQTPIKIKILAPVFNPTFLWKLAKDVAIYKRKNLDVIEVFALNFTEGADAEFFLNECVELQELFPKIKIYKINLAKAKDVIKMAPGVILMVNGNQKAFTFETEFSTSGFDIPGVLSGIPITRALDYFDELNGESSAQINRDTFSQLLRETNLSQYSTPEEVINGDAAFELTFVSTKTKKIHNAGAGLNWGQHTSSRGRKDLNAAYIHVPKSIQLSPQLPRPGVNFLCKFDDGIEFDMVRTGEGGKNLTSAYENQIFGRYIRFRLGISPGLPIDNALLEKAGFFSALFLKVAENFYRVKLSDSLNSKTF